MTHAHMQEKKPKWQKIVGIVCAACLVLAVVAALASTVLSNTYYSQYRTGVDIRQAALKEIVNYLEFNGLDDTVKEKMLKHSEKYTDFSNFIIVDPQGSVMYSLNQGHLDDSGKFKVAIARGITWSPVIVQLNQDDKPIGWFGAQIDNISALESIARNLEIVDTGGLVSGENYTIQEPIYDSGSASVGVSIMNGEGEFVISEGNQLAPETIYYSGFPTKNMHLFFFFDENNPKWRQEVVDPYEWDAPDIAATVGVSALVGYWGLLVIWVFMDASRRESRPVLWAILALFTNIIGLIIYLLVRPIMIKCEGCGYVLQGDYTHCPVCGTRGKEQCPGCQKIINRQWLTCPYCGTGLEGIAAQAPQEKDDEETPAPTA